MKAYLFDVESTGLLRQNSQLHCIVLRNLLKPSEDPLVFDTVQNNLDDGVELLQSADILSGHNIVSYDIALLKELYPAFKVPQKILDTLILSRIYYSTLADRDFQRRPYGLPKKLYGSHSLKAWGIRLGCHKGDYGEQANAWDVYTPEMLEYCKQDVQVNVELFHFLNQQLSETDRLPT